MAFGWTQTDNEGEILVVGGTDGNVLQEDTYLIDFKQ